MLRFTTGKKMIDHHWAGLQAQTVSPPTELLIILQLAEAPLMSFLKESKGKASRFNSTTAVKNGKGQKKSIHIISVL